jgi:hypothetical protein
MARLMVISQCRQASKLISGPHNDAIQRIAGGSR